jgi:hypothetical protein
MTIVITPFACVEVSELPERAPTISQMGNNTWQRLKRSEIDMTDQQ